MMAAKRRSFRREWEYEYLFVDRQGLPQCIVCRKMLSTMRRFNIRRHYECFHKKRYENIFGAARYEVVKHFKTMLSTKKYVKARPIKKEQEFIDIDDEFELQDGEEVPLDENEIKDFEQILVTSSSCSKCEENQKKATVVEQRNKVLEAKLKETQSKLTATTTAALTKEERLVQILGEDNEKITAVADTCFLLSLAPSLETMSESEKSSIKIQFLQAIVNVQTERKKQKATVSQASSIDTSTSYTTVLKEELHTTADFEDDHFSFKYENI